MASPKDYSEDFNSLYYDEQNKKKLKELKEKYGMRGSGANENASPELINQFLDNVLRFEEAYEKAEMKKVIEVLEYPEFKKTDDLTPETINDEIENVINFYNSHNININVIEESDVSEEDFYKFLTQELPQEEMQCIDDEGFRTNFIYEDFHPNDKLDAKNSVEYFLHGLLENKEKDSGMWLSNKNLSFNRKRMELPEFLASVRKLMPKNICKIEKNFSEFKPGKIVSIKADLIIYIDDLEQARAEKMPLTLHLYFELERCEFGELEIISCSNLAENQ